LQTLTVLSLFLFRERLVYIVGTSWRRNNRAVSLIAKGFGGQALAQSFGVAPNTTITI
jgi:hypothetical protein